MARLVVEDLLAIRRAGASPASVIAEGVRAVASKAGDKLRFVLLVGDAPSVEDGALGFTPVPTFYLPKVAYEESERRAPRRSYDRRSFAAEGGRSYASDLPYAYANRGAPGQPTLAVDRSPRPLAVGRVPARTAEEASGFARKAIGYDAARPEGAWRRRLEIIGGPANFGALTDYLIENTATRALDAEVPYDFDVRVAFLKMESPYVLPFPFVRERIAADLNAGALIAAYVGHGAPTSFAYVRQGYRYYAVGTTEDASALRIPDGKPFFLSITCNTGEFDLPDDHRSLAEGMILNPEGPIAVFAASRESHPYPNALYGEAFVDVFLKGRAATVGEGVLDVKRRIQESDIPLAPLLFDNDAGSLVREHEGLYNLFGDPATRLRYASSATVSVAGSSGGVAPASKVVVVVESAAIREGSAALTLETKRSVIRGALVSPETIKGLPDAEAWATVDRNYAMASDKVMERSTQRVLGGRATFEVVAPKAPGEYALKVLVSGGGDAAAGYAKLVVKAADGS